MPIFNSITELQNWINSPHGQNSVLDESKIKQLLREAGEKLERYMKEELQVWFDSYEPVEYARTGYTMESFRVGEPKKININQWELQITFFEGLANHPSYIGGSQPDGYTPWLMNSGWQTKLDSKLSIKNFTRFEGTNYITRAVERFNAENEYGFKVEVMYNGEDVTGRIYHYGK
jgi:hypothetical protein